MTPRRVPVVLWLVLALSGCATTAPYEQGLAEGERTVIELTRKVEAHERQVIDGIKAGATSVQAFDDALAVQHKKREPVNRALATVHSLGIILRAAIVAVDAGMRPIADLAEIAAGLIPAVKAVKDLAAMYLGER